MALDKEISLEWLVQDVIGPYPLTPLIKEMIAFLLKGICESLILVDKNGKIEYLDKFTENFFNIKRGEGKGLHITDLMPESRLHIAASTGMKEVGKIQKVRGEDKIVTRFPIKKNGNIIGAIGKIMFQKLEEIDNLNKEISSLKLRLNHYKKGLKDLNSAQYTFEDIVGLNEKFLRVKELAMRAALTESNILLLGESGTGKELFAHSIHNISPRKDKPFVRVNCATIPFELAESELFGYEKGAFSGARAEGKLGKFELSEGGTIFLDEISCLPSSIQSKLLRVLQEREIERLGGRNTIKVDFRLIAATNSSLTDMLAEGRFRSDLFYRISNVPIEIPPLRERKDDIIFYIEHFSRQINRRLQTDVKGISKEASEVMTHYRWPGNLRELMNVLEQTILRVMKGHITPEYLPSFLLGKDYDICESSSGLRSILEETEKQAIKRALNFTRGNKRKAAGLLGIQRPVLYQKLRKYQISFP